MLLPVLLLALAAPAGDEPVARVDGVAITRATFRLRDASLREEGQQLPPRQLLDALVDETLLSAEARRTGVAAEPAVVERLALERRRVATAVFLEREIGSKVQPSDAELRAAFHETADFAKVDVLAYETREAAAAALARLAGGSPLAAEAAKALTSKVYARPVEAPMLLRAQLEPGLAAAVFGPAGKPGAFVGPFELSAGFGVAHVIDRQVGDEAAFAARRPALAAGTKRRAVEQAREHLAAQARARAGVKIDEAFLNGLRGVEASPAELDHVLATVNGYALRYREIYDSVRAVAGTGGGHLSGGGVKIELARRAVDQRLVEDLAQERGYATAPETVAQAAAAERALLAWLMMDRLRAGAPAPTEQEIQAFYARNAAAYGKPFQEVLPDVARRAAAEKGSRTLEARLKALREKARVEVYDEALKRAAGRDT